MVKIKVKSEKELHQKACSIFDELYETYLPCEALFIVSEITKMQSIAMLETMLEREQEAN